MAASVKIYELTASKAGTDKTSGTVRFKNANNQTVDSNDRLSIPSTGTRYSFTKQLRIYVATAPSVDIQTLAAYSDGEVNFGGGQVGVQYDTFRGASFVTNATPNISGTDLFTRGPATVIDMDAGLASTAFLGTGFKGLILRLQMSVASLANPGSLTASAETLTISYSET